MSSSENSIRLVYGDGGQGLLFLEESYAKDIGDFRFALQRADTWGELKRMVSEERYRETVEKWAESEEIEATTPPLDKNFNVEEFANFSELEWPEFSPYMMTTWVDDRIIVEFGGYIEPMFDDAYPLIDADKEEQVVSLLKSRGYECARDDALIWRSIFGD